MTVTFTGLTSGTDTDATINTASISPTNTPVFVAVAFSRTSGAFPPAATCSGCGLTWTEVANTDYAFRRNLTVLEGNGTPSSGSLTIENADASINGAAYAVFEYTNIDSLGTAATASGVGATATTTLTGSPATGDISLAVSTLESDANPTWEASYTERYDVSETGNVRRFTVADADPYDGTPSVTFDASDGWGMIGFYIFAAGAPPAGPSIPVFMHHYRQQGMI